MITGELKSKVDSIWDTMWSGGISNPLSVIEQLTYLLFIKRLDELHTLKENKAARTGNPIEERRCCTARSKSLTSLCRLQSHPAQYVSGIPSAAILLSISHPIRCSTRCLANVRACISGPMIAL